MKNVFTKMTAVSLPVAVLAFSALHATEAMNQISLPIEGSFNKQSISQASYMNRKWHHMLAMETVSIVRTYHCGLEKLFAGYSASTAENLLQEISSYSDSLYAPEDAYANPHNVLYQVFATEENGRKHFYVFHGDGIRHFVVNAYKADGKLMAGLNNTTTGDYISFPSFLRSTLV